MVNRSRKRQSTRKYFFPIHWRNLYIYIFSSDFYTSRIQATTTNGLQYFPFRIDIGFSFFMIQNLSNFSQSGAFICPAMYRDSALSGSCGPVTIANSDCTKLQNPVTQSTNLMQPLQSNFCKNYRVYSTFFQSFESSLYLPSDCDRDNVRAIS